MKVLKIWIEPFGILISHKTLYFATMVSANRDLGRCGGLIRLRAVYFSGDCINQPKVLVFRW